MTQLPALAGFALPHVAFVVCVVLAAVVAGALMLGRAGW